MGRNHVQAAWEVENGGDFLSLPPLNICFSSPKHLLLSLLSPRGRWAGGQARPKLGGGGADRERWDSPSLEDHQVGVSLLP